MAGSVGGGLGRPFPRRQAGGAGEQTRVEERQQDPGEQQSPPHPGGAQFEQLGGHERAETGCPGRGRVLRALRPPSSGPLRGRQRRGYGGRRAGRRRVRAVDEPQEDCLQVALGRREPVQFDAGSERHVPDGRRCRAAREDLVGPGGARLDSGVRQGRDQSRGGGGGDRTAAAPASSSSVPARTSRPRATMTTSSTVCCTSDST